MCVALARADARAQGAEVVAPQLERMPELNLPPDAELPPDGLLSVEITVAADGSAQLAHCDAQERVCTLVGHALSEASFSPARRAGEAIAARVRLSLRVAQPEAAAGTPAASQAASVEVRE